MAIWNYSLFWTKNLYFGPKNADIIKIYCQFKTSLGFYASSYSALVVCQKFAAKRYLSKVSYGG